MPVNRNLWNQALTHTETPLWPCATCRAGLLTLEKDSLVAEQTASSRQESAEDWWDPDMYRGRFVAALRCGNRKCKDLTVVAGDVVVEEDYNVEEQQVWQEEKLLPRFFSPGPNLISVPADVPEAVTEDIRTACQVIWTEPAAAGNRIRTAIERLMDDRGMRRKRRTKKGKFEQLTLHERIEEFRQEEPELGNSLLAVKWLGNAGSHSGLTRDNVFDALDIVEHVLDEIYTQRARTVAKLANRINKARGPVPPIRRRKGR